MFKYILGLDIGGTKCAVVLAKVGREIEILKRVQLDTYAERGFEQIWNRLLECVDSVIFAEGLIPSQLYAIGVSCGGPLDSNKGIVLSPPNLPGWDNIPIVQMLEKKYGVPAFLQNDAKACALVEWAIGAGQRCRNMLFLTMGTGFGCGVIANGELLTGANCMCGEVGHIRLAETGPVGFGKEGSVEGFCSGGGIARFMQIESLRMTDAGHIPAWVRDGVPEEKYSAKLLSEYAGNGDSDALEIWEKIGENLGRALAILIDAFNPECIVIGSIYVRCEAFLKDGMERILAQEAIEFSRSACRIVPAETGESIGDLASIMAACVAAGFLPYRYDMPQRAQHYYDDLFRRYLVLEPLREAIQCAYELLSVCFSQGGKLLICGNGGSAADAEHIVGELMKGFHMKRPVSSDKEKRAILSALGEEGLCLQQSLPAIALTQHYALSTAFSNDVNPDYCFAQQLLGYGKQGDTLLSLSTSGNSKNVVAAAKLAAALGIRVIALTGPDSGLLGQYCDVAIPCPGNSTAEVQEMHLPVYHALCAMLEATFFCSNMHTGTLYDEAHETAAAPLR